MKKNLYTYIISLVLLFGYFNSVDAQNINSGTIEGRIYNAKNNEPIPFATIIIWETTIGTVSDLDGRFLFTGIKPGYVQLRASSVGFEDFITTQFLVTNAKNSYIEIALQEANIELDAVVVKASPFRKQEESPVSLRRIGVAEIEKNPGGNRDISRVIQSFPGVSSTPAYRNDVIVRGGGPSESKFYLDGVEIPNLNHFATQGASGGPVGIINVDFIREVNFYSGAFPANRGNALSSILDFRQIDGNKEKTKFRATVGASDLALTLDGPLGDKTSYIFSARRSYLQFLFAALELPFLPTYNDFQFKLRTRFDEKNELTVIGLGALDQNKLNLNANETAEQRYILGYLPENDQWNYTFGFVYRHYRENGFDTWVLSRNLLNNVAYKHELNDESLPRTLDYSSMESENKFRYEHNSTTKNNFKINYGLNFEYAKYENSTFRKLVLNETSQDLNYSSFLDMFNYGLFGQVSRNYLGNRLVLSAGLRFDGSSYSDEMSNLLKQFSPRFSASYILSEELSLNFNTGRYYQRPPYTALGYQDNSGEFVNRKNGISFIESDQVVAGLEFRPDDKSNFSIEGFYKHYRNYPFSLSDSVALATKGADFGTFGDEALVPIAEGRAYGLEIFGRTLDLKGVNLIVSYTLVWSEFKNSGLQSSQREYIPTSWDNRHIFNVTATRSFKRNWDFGFKWRFVGAAPYTPFDVEKSSIKEVWDATGTPSPDYTLFNSLRLKPFHQLDIRIDKQYFFKKWSLMLYVDIQNLYNFKAFEPDRLVRNSIVNPGTADLIDDNGIEKYELVYLKSDGSGTVLPTVGIMVEF
ncbi:MAG: TonB-dependent receptor [Bacteroidales bacterium]|nr:TonB-dependent receptor [Bacteroidales bacterium]